MLYAQPPQPMPIVHASYPCPSPTVWAPSTLPYAAPMAPVPVAAGASSQRGDRVRRRYRRRVPSAGPAPGWPPLPTSPPAASGSGSSGHPRPFGGLPQGGPHFPPGGHASDDDDIDDVADISASGSSSSPNGGEGSESDSSEEDEWDDLGVDLPEDCAIPFSDAELEEMFGKDSPVFQEIMRAKEMQQRQREILRKALALGTYYMTHFKKKPKRQKKKQSGIEWVEETVGNQTSCYNIFRMNPPVFELLHDVLVSSYGLKSTSRMSSREALAMFLWMLGPPQSVRQVEYRFVWSMETISRKFDHVLLCVAKLAKDIIRPKDPTYSTVHPLLANSKYAPFKNAIGAIDGTHVRVTVPGEKVGVYINRKTEKTQNVLVICDFEKRFTFVAAGIPGSAHDWTVLQEARRKYGAKFPHPPPGKFYLVDAGYPNRPGYLSPCTRVKYHQCEWLRNPEPRGKKEAFNKVHSSLRSVIEQSFGILKNKWRVLKAIPSYPEAKQTKIILACCALHNFIKENDAED